MRKPKHAIKLNSLQDLKVLQPPVVKQIDTTPDKKALYGNVNAILRNALKY